MLTPAQLEEAFLEFSQNLQKHAPDGVISVDLNLLHDLGLLEKGKMNDSTTSDELMHYFHVLETPDKVTLFNEQFVVWILPKMIQEIPLTLIFIGRFQSANKPYLELVFSTTGVYNTPKFILKVLEHFLTEVIDTEAIISSIDKPKPTGTDPTTPQQESG